MCYIPIYDFRYAQRIVHVPFFAPQDSDDTEQLDYEHCLNSMRSLASSSIGAIISLGSHLVSESTKRYIKDELLPLITKNMPSAHHRVKKCYALVLVAAKLVRNFITFKLFRFFLINKLCEVTSGITFQEVLDFFVQTWAPIVEKLHQHKGDIISEFLESVLLAIKDMPTNEVIMTRLYHKPDQLFQS